LSSVADDSALKFHRSPDWRSFYYQELEVIADRAKVPTRLIVSTAKETAERFDDVWRRENQPTVLSRNNHRNRKSPKEPSYL